jgi:hypothetical protein
MIDIKRALTTNKYTFLGTRIQSVKEIIVNSGIKKPCPVRGIPVCISYSLDTANQASELKQLQNPLSQHIIQGLSPWWITEFQPDNITVNVHCHEHHVKTTKPY